MSGTVDCYSPINFLNIKNICKNKLEYNGYFTFDCIQFSIEFTQILIIKQTNKY